MSLAKLAQCQEDVAGVLQSSTEQLSGTIRSLRKLLGVISGSLSTSARIAQLQEACTFKDTLSLLRHFDCKDCKESSGPVQLLAALVKARLKITSTIARLRKIRMEILSERERVLQWIPVHSSGGPQLPAPKENERI